MIEKKRWTMTLLIAAGLGLAFAASSSADMITLREGGDAGLGITNTTVDDAYIVSRGSADVNHGTTDGTLKLQTLSNGDVVQEVGLIRFDFAPLPPGPLTVTSATLRLTGTDTIVKDSVSVYRVLTNWSDESDVTWNHPDGASAFWASGIVWDGSHDTTSGFTTADYTTDGAASFIPSGPYHSAKNIDVTDIVKDMLVSANNGFAILIPDGTTSTKYSATFVSSEAQTTANRPTLTIIYTVPEPASGVLLLLGLGALTMLPSRKRRKKLRVTSY